MDVWPSILHDVAAGRLEPLYNTGRAAEPPGHDDPPLAAPHRAALRRTAASYARRRARLPVPCSFCTIINVQGRTIPRATRTTSSGIVKAT